jgi:hypothetical protein
MQIFSFETAIFEKCKTLETAYKFVWDKLIDEEFAF